MSALLGSPHLVRRIAPPSTAYESLFCPAAAAHHPYAPGVEQHQPVLRYGGGGHQSDDRPDKENDYLQAATATGTTRMGALVRHVLPNVAAPIIVVFSINIGAVIISEGVAELPGIRSVARDSEMGDAAEPGRPQVHGAGAVAGAVVRPVPDHHRLQPQHVRRRRPGPAGPAPPGWRRTPRNPRRPHAATRVRSQPLAPVSTRGRSRR